MSNYTPEGFRREFMTHSVFGGMMGGEPIDAAAAADIARAKDAIRAARAARAPSIAPGRNPTCSPAKEVEAERPTEKEFPKLPIELVRKSLLADMETSCAYAHAILGMHHPTVVAAGPVVPMLGGGNYYKNMGGVFRQLLEIKKQELKAENKRLSDNSWNRVTGLINNFQNLEKKVAENPSDKASWMKHKQDMIRLRDIFNTLYPNAN